MIFSFQKRRDGACPQQTWRGLCRLKRGVSAKYFIGSCSRISTQCHLVIHPIEDPGEEEASPAEADDEVEVGRGEDVLDSIPTGQYDLVPGHPLLAAHSQPWSRQYRVRRVDCFIVTYQMWIMRTMTL